MYRIASRWAAGGTSVSTRTWPRAGASPLIDWRTSGLAIACRTSRASNSATAPRVAHVALVLLQLPFELPLDVAPVLFRDPVGAR